MSSLKISDTLSFIAPSMNSIYTCLSALIFVSIFSLTTVSLVRAHPTIVKENQLGFGLHYAYSDVLFDKLGIQFSMLYERKLSEILQIEGSINFLGNSYMIDGPIGRKRLFHSVTGSSNLIFNLSGSAEQKLRCGGGVSLRQLSSIYAVDAQNPFAQNATIRYVADYAVGANLLVDYVVPVTRNLDITLRLQGQGFTSPFATDEFLSLDLPIIRPFAFAITFGAFVRIGF